MSGSSVPSDQILSVSAITELMRELIEPAFSQIWVMGEVSNLRRQASGHTYFTLKDESAQLPAVLFRGNARNLQAPLRDGQKVMAFGRMSIYPPSGRYQLICQHILPAGQGLLMERFEELRRKLEGEGLFAAESKRPLPTLPRSIGIITSPSGAALRDFLSILARRAWAGRVVVLPARVQGAEAAGEIAHMVHYAERSGLFDTLVLSRGGGSLEDLWPFNEEIVARAVAQCPLPTISAVGHETDYTLCDFASDMRAETPSGAAELISSLRLEAKERVEEAVDVMNRAVSLALERAGARVEVNRTKLVLQSPRRRIEHSWLRLDEMARRLRGAADEGFAERKNAAERAAMRLQRATPARRIELASERLMQLSRRLESASAKSVLKRGFAIIRSDDPLHAQPDIVTSASSMHKGQRLTIELHDGTQGVTVD